MRNLYRYVWLFVLVATLFSSCQDAQKKGNKPGEGRTVLNVDGQVLKLQNLDFNYSYTGKLLANEEIDIGLR
jgi:hypothetical protein